MGKSSICMLVLVETLNSLYHRVQINRAKASTCANHHSSASLKLKAAECWAATTTLSAEWEDSWTICKLSPATAQAAPRKTGRLTNLFCLLSFFMSNTLSFQNSLWQKELELKKNLPEIGKAWTSLLQLPPVSFHHHHPLDKSSQLTSNVCERRIFHC